MVDQMDPALERRLRAAYRQESAERLRDMVSALLALEKHPDVAETAALVEGLHRNAHSLKGGARLIGLSSVERICHAMESGFVRSRNPGFVFTTAALDLLHQSVTLLTSLCATDGPVPATGGADRQVEELTQALTGWAEGGDVASPAPKPSSAVSQERTTPPSADDTEPKERGVPVATETVRVSAEILNGLLYHAEELLAPKMRMAYLCAELKGLREMMNEGRRSFAVARREARESLKEYDRAPGGGARARTEEWMERAHTWAQLAEERIQRIMADADQDKRALGGMVESLLEEMKEILLAPARTMVESLPMLARDLAKAEGKEVAMTIEGDEIEMDRRVLDALRTPLVHVVRNCVDHGVENPAEREMLKKPACGGVWLTIRTLDGGRVQFVIRDDGRGIDPAQVRRAALRWGGLSPEATESLSDGEACDLVFRSGFTTAATVSEISGRGLGMAIVRETVERLGGEVTVEPGTGTGTVIRIVAPLLLTTFRGISVYAGGQCYVFPLSAVERVARVPADAVRSVENRPSIAHGGGMIPLVELAVVLEREGAARMSGGMIPVVIVRRGGTAVAFAVERILAVGEALVKDLGPQLARVRNVMGVSVMDTGEMAPVLHVADLLTSATSGGTPHATAPWREAEQDLPTLLVVEDSITARMLLQQILEAAGHRVVTAVDGVDALRKLKEGGIDMVVSDIEMPRMDGLALTAAIRADKVMGALPVALVTTLDSRESRERGMEAGADAYIVKSAFDQRELLAIIARLCGREAP